MILKKYTKKAEFREYENIYSKYALNCKNLVVRKTIILLPLA